MEIHILCSILVTLFFFLIVISSIKRSSSKKSIKSLPPEPWKLPLIGNLHQFVGSLPHHSLRNLAKKYGPIMHLQLGETSNVVISDPEITKEILQTHDAVFASRPRPHAAEIITYGYADMAFAPYGSYWRQLRKMCASELLAAKRVQLFRYIREKEVSTLIKEIAENEGSIFNIGKRIPIMINDIIGRAAFGNKSKDQEAFISNTEKIVQILGGFSIADLYPSIKVLRSISGMKAKAEKLRRENDRIFENIIRDHEEKNRVHGMQEEENFVDVLLKIQRKNDLELPFTHENVKAVILDMFGGGTETSSRTIEWAMSELAINPKVMEKAQAEVRSVFRDKGDVDETDLQQLKYLNAIIKETLRLHPPAPLLARRLSDESVEICGYQIPANSKVIINAWAMARDPKYWTEAEKFQPGRFLDNSTDFRGSNFEFIPFGAGRRICPGITYAISNVELTLASLLYHFDWKLPNGMKREELDMTDCFGTTIRKKENLCLIPIRYYP